MRVLVVGGAGYIGAHVCKALAARGDEPVVFDNLSSGHEHAVRWGPLVRGDARRPDDLAAAFRDHRPEAVVHLAAHIEVAESEREPYKVWQNNVGGALALLGAMRDAGCHRLVFSSTCAIYGQPETLPLSESAPRNPISVYGRTKLTVEHILADIARAEGLRYVALRFFNAAGASPDGEIGEEHEPETHLIPRALKAAAGLGAPFDLYGTDYQTHDGTCVRDFIHVMDLAAAHLVALDRVTAQEGGFACNIGTGRGYSVREVLDMVETVTGSPVPFAEKARRPGDPAELFADVTLARDGLGFTPARSDLESIVRDAWNFHRPRWLAGADPARRRSG